MKHSRRRIEHATAAAHHVAAHGVAPRRLEAQLQQHQFALEVLAAGHVLHADDVDQLVQLVGDLLDDRVRAGGHQRQARDGGVVGRGHRQRLDVVAAGGEQAGDAGQGAGLVLQQDGDDVSHGKTAVGSVGGATQDNGSARVCTTEASC